MSRFYGTVIVLAIGTLVSLVSAAQNNGSSNAPASAQDLQGIAAIVGDDLITMADVRRRMQLVATTSNLNLSQEQLRGFALQTTRELIDERLQTKAADDVEIDLQEDFVNEALDTVAQRNGYQGAAELAQVLQAGGSDIDELRARLQVEIRWVDAVKRRWQGQVFISEAAIDEELASLERLKGEREYLLSELFLPVTAGDNEVSVQQFAYDLRAQINSEQDFARLAAQFSAGINQTGDLGWVREGSLSSIRQAALKAMSVGDVVGPIRVPEGYILLNLRAQRLIGEASPLDTSVLLARLMIGAGDPREPARLFGSILAQAGGCDQLAGLAVQNNLPAQDIILGRGRLGDLPPDYINAVAELALGEATEIIDFGDMTGILIVCDRQEAPPPSPPTRDQVRFQLESMAFDLVARRWLDDLRRDTYVEIRIQ
ncbi:MAG: peptidylprolyl isomerase [Pseudomonadota bacterium]